MDALLAVAVIGFFVLDYTLYSISGALHSILEELRATRKAVDGLQENLKPKYGTFADRTIDQLQDIEKAVQQIDLS